MQKEDLNYHVDRQTQKTYSKALTAISPKASVEENVVEIFGDQSPNALCLHVMLILLSVETEHNDFILVAHLRCIDAMRYIVLVDRL